MEELQIRFSNFWSSKFFNQRVELSYFYFKQTPCAGNKEEATRRTYLG